MYCNRSDDVTACKEQKCTTRDEVEWCDCCSLHAVTSSVIYYSTHTRKNVIYLFYTIKIQMVYWKILGHEKRKTSPLTWYGMDLTSSFNRSRYNNQWKCTQQSRYGINIFTDFLIFLTINPNPPCQLSQLKETGEPGENPLWKKWLFEWKLLSAEC